MQESFFFKNANKLESVQTSNYQVGYLDVFNFLAKFPSGSGDSGTQGRVMEEVGRKNRERGTGSITEENCEAA